MLIVPLAQVPNQSRLVSLNSQNCQFNVYQKSTGLFMDILLEKNGAMAPILSGVLCRNQCPLVMTSYLGFVGELMWVDTFSTNMDPVYTGFSAQFQLMYLFPAEIPLGAIFCWDEPYEFSVATG